MGENVLLTGVKMHEISNCGFRSLIVRINAQMHRKWYFKSVVKFLNFFIHRKIIYNRKSFQNPNRGEIFGAEVKCDYYGFLACRVRVSGW